MCEFTMCCTILCYTMYVFYYIMTMYVFLLYYDYDRDFSVQLEMASLAITLKTTHIYLHKMFNTYCIIF